MGMEFLEDCDGNNLSDDPDTPGVCWNDWHWDGVVVELVPDTGSKTACTLAMSINVFEKKVQGLVM